MQFCAAGLYIVCWPGAARYSCCCCHKLYCVPLIVLAEDSERALCALLGQLDELTARSEALTTERDAQVADAAALRVALQKERQACQEHAAQGKCLYVALCIMRLCLQAK